MRAIGRDALVTEGDGTEADGAWGEQRQGANAKLASNGGRGGRENTKFPQLYPMPSDGDPVASVGVFKIYTKSLVSIGDTVPIQ